MNRIYLVALSLVAVLVVSPMALAQQLEEQTVQAATAVLAETMATPGNQIPQAMLSDAHGVAIIPNVIKGGFVVGARHGRGVLFIREPDGAWHAPVFITLTGGNIGWQVGLQSSDIILVFKTPRSIQGILSGKLTIGADAAAAAGPVGRQTAAATDGKLQAEIYTYSRSRGLFAGVSIDGSVVRIDQLATGAYYHSAGPGQPLIVPPSAQQLTQTVAAYAAGSPSEPAATSSTGLPGLSPAPAAVPQVSNLQPSSIVQQHRATNADVIRNQLTQTAPELYELVDEGWKNYLALPSQVFLTGPHPSSAEVGAALERFNRVATDPAFAKLAARPEFQSVHAMLKHYQQSLNPQTSNLPLPAPPDFGAPPIH